MSGRHNRIRDLIFGLASNAGLNPIKEKPNILPSQPNRRPGDVFIPTLFDGKAAALDVAVTCPVQPKYSKGTKIGVEDYAANVKHKSYDDGFLGTDIDFLPVLVDTFGRWGSEALLVLGEIASRGAKRLCISPSFYVPQSWQRLSVVLHRCISRMVLSRILTVNQKMLTAMEFISPSWNWNWWKDQK